MQQIFPWAALFDRNAAAAFRRSEDACSLYAQTTAECLFGRMGSSCTLGRPRMSFLCIRAEEFPTQTLFSLRPELKVLPAAVLEHDPPLERVCSLNAKAFERGVRRGM